MHNAWFRKAKLKYVYLAIEPNRKNLKKIFHSIKLLGFSDFNIIFPYKIKAVKYIDIIDNTLKK
jgi:shikimate 5-dehydrogenase